MSRGHDLRTLGSLTSTHVGRTVTIGRWTGRLVGLLPLGDRIQARLVVAGCHVWTDALPADTHVEVAAKEAVS